ncbi:MAG TPA: carbohydrate ABC transporter permease, partial [Acidimicrobiales bacterium]|nr:carbohydrate ABC transporter permease [Acidimicrobiales bacterium]
MSTAGSILTRPRTAWRTPARRRRLARRAPLFATMVGVAVIMLYPFWFMITTSLHTEAQYESGHGFSFASWGALNSELPVLRQLLNSTIICACSIALILAVSLAAGYGLGKLRFRGSETVFLCLVAAMMIPVQSILMPEYVNVSKLGLTGGYFGAVLVYAALGTPFATFLMATYFRNLPDELLEAGICDGLSHGGTLVRI